MQERILNTLITYLQSNRNTLSEIEIKDIEEQITAVKNYKPEFKSKFRTNYPNMQ